MKTTRSKMQKTPNGDDAPVTRGMIAHMFENMKDFTHSTVEASITKLRKELKTDINLLEHAVTQHSKFIKDLDVKITGVHTELKNEMQGMRIELKEEIQGVRTELKEEIQGVRTELAGKIDSVESNLANVRTELKEEIQGVRTELMGKMDSVESNLTEKIEGQKPILQNHEERITALESL